MVLGKSCLVLLLREKGWDLARKQSVHVWPDLVGLCPREGVKDTSAPGREVGGEVSTSHSGDRGVCRQAGRGQPGQAGTFPKTFFLGGSRGITGMSGGCSLGGAQLHLHVDEPNPNNQDDSSPLSP